MGRPAAPVMAAHQTVPQCVPGQPCQLGLEHCQGAWSPGDARSATTDIHNDSTGHSMSHLSTSIRAIGVSRGGGGQGILTPPFPGPPPPFHL